MSSRADLLAVQRAPSRWHRQTGPIGFRLALAELGSGYSPHILGSALVKIVLQVRAAWNVLAAANAYKAYSDKLQKQGQP
jgi:hypothetical protein